MSAWILFLVTALVNAIWQPALLAAIAWLALKLSRCSNATTRHAVWTLALVGSAVVPVLSALPVVAPHAAVSSSGVSLAQAAHVSTMRPPHAYRVQAQVPQIVPALSLQRPSFQVRPTIAMVASIAWLVVALAILARLLVSFLYLERLKHDALPFPVEARTALTRYERAKKGDRDVRVCVSEEITVPVAVGIFDAMILLPRDLVQELDANDLDRILLHELGHVRRSDDWVNLFERIVQALLFFSPGIYWISRQMDLEREVACDDWVLEQSAENVPYARCLARIVEITQWPYVAPAAPGVFVTRKSMSIRIERLLARGRDIRVKLALVPSLLSLALIAAIVIAGGFVSPTIAYTIDHAAVTHPTLTRPIVPQHKRAALHEGVAALPQNAAALQIPVLATKHSVASIDTEVDKSVNGAVSAAVKSATASRLSTPGRMIADTDYIDVLASEGYKNLTADELIELKSLGIDRSYIDALRGAGLKDLTVRDLIELKSLGVDGDYVKELTSAGYGYLDAREYTEFKSLGVDGDWLAQMRDAGLSKMSAHETVELRSLGVDGDYVRSLASAGYTHLDPRSYAEFKSLGVDGAWLADMRNAGLTQLSANDVMELRSLGVDGAYVRDLADNGYADLSAREYVRLKSLGVDGNYIRSLAGHGITHLTVDQLARYKSLGIPQ